MKTLQIQVYGFDELSEDTKEKALDRYRFFNVEDSFWYDLVYEDFIALCETVGITVITDSIHFCGFYSQGDGSTFGADVDILQFIKGIETQSWKEYAPKVELNIAPFKLDNRIKALLENGMIDGYCTVRNPLRGNWINVDTSFDYPVHQCKNYRCIDEHLDLLENWLEKAIERLNRYLYKFLEEEYDYQTSDESVREAILSNNYQFTIDGKEAERLLTLEANREA